MMITHKLPFLNIDFDIDTDHMDEVKKKYQDRERNQFSDMEIKECESPIHIKMNFGDIEGNVLQLEINMDDARNIVMNLLGGMSELGDPTAKVLCKNLADLC